MKKLLCSLVAIPLFACITTAKAAPDADWEPAGKWSLAERQAWTALHDETLGYLKDLNSTCGTKIPVEFEYETFRGKFKENERVGLDAYGLAHVQVPIAGTENICKVGSREKTAVAAGISKIVFVHGKGGKGAKSSISLKGKTLRAVIEPAAEAAGTWQEEIESYVKAHI